MSPKHVHIVYIFKNQQNSTFTKTKINFYERLIKVHRSKLHLDLSHLMNNINLFNNLITLYMSRTLNSVILQRFGVFFYMCNV